MEILNNIKCAINSKKSLNEIYHGLSEEELIDRKSYHLKIFFYTSVSWTIALILILWSASMDMPLLILFTGAIFAHLILLWQDYRNKTRMIDDILNSN